MLLPEFTAGSDTTEWYLVWFFSWGLSAEKIVTLLS